MDLNKIKNMYCHVRKSCTTFKIEVPANVFSQVFSGYVSLVPRISFLDRVSHLADILHLAFFAADAVDNVIANTGDLCSGGTLSSCERA